jgi:acyl-CoA dehydrogenase
MTVAFGDGILVSPHASGPTEPAWSVTGHAARVPWARDHTTIVVMDDRGLVATPARDAYRIEPGENVAREPRDTVRFNGSVEATGDARLTRVQLRAIAAAFRAQQIAGALERLTAMTVQYALDRTQFGRPIGKFQAVQQNLAVLAGQTAAAGAAADMAAEALGAMADAGEARAGESGAGGMELAPGPARTQEIDRLLLPLAAAKARCGEAAGIGASIAHQVHGAIGFTHEHSLHFITKRLWSWRDEFGNETVWNQFVGRHMAKVGPGRYWAEITAA